MEDKELLQMTEQDILAKLKGEFKAPTINVLLDRIGIVLTLKGLSEKEISKARQECTYTSVKKGKVESKVDDAEFDAALIVAATTNFDWNDKSLCQVHQVGNGKEVIRKLILPGEIKKLEGQVLELSGYIEDLHVIEDIKN